LALFRNYPGDPALQEYLRHAMRQGTLSLNVFISAFLSAARSLELQNVSTLDSLCRLALEQHYSSGLPPLGSVISFTQPLSSVLNTVRDAMELLRIAHTLVSSQIHRLTNSASELLILLISPIQDISQIPPTQALRIFDEAHQLQQIPRLSHDVKQVLDGFVYNLTLIAGDERAAREAEMIHTLQLAMGKTDMGGANASGRDMVSCGLVLHHLVRPG
jgi:mediator of RNA polymerase II transcription subunit 5